MGTLLEITQADSTKSMDELKEMIISFCGERFENQNALRVDGEFDESTRKYIIKMPVESYSNFN